MILGGSARACRAIPSISHSGNEMKKLIALLALGCAVLAGCNTMSGIGKDIQAGGQKLENAADNTKEKM